MQGSVLFGGATALADSLFRGRPAGNQHNRAERSIKSFVIDRKNLLFANTSLGVRGSVIIFGLVETAKENGLDRTAFCFMCSERHLIWTRVPKIGWIRTSRPTLGTIAKSLDKI